MQVYKIDVLLLVRTLQKGPVNRSVRQLHFPREQEAICWSEDDDDDDVEELIQVDDKNDKDDVITIDDDDRNKRWS